MGVRTYREGHEQGNFDGDGVRRENVLRLLWLRHRGNSTSKSELRQDQQLHQARRRRVKLKCTRPLENLPQFKVVPSIFWRACSWRTPYCSTDLARQWNGSTPAQSYARIIRTHGHTRVRVHRDGSTSIEYGNIEQELILVIRAGARIDLSSPVGKEIRHACTRKATGLRGDVRCRYVISTPDFKTPFSSGVVPADEIKERQREG